MRNISSMVSVPNQAADLDALKALYVRPRSEVKKVMSSPPTITTSTSAPGATYPTGWPHTVTSNSNWEGVVNFYGGFPARVGNRIRLRSVTSNATTATDPLSYVGFNDGISRMAFTTDSPIFVLAINTANSLPFRFLIDGEYVSLTGTQAAATGDSYITLDFTAVGGRKFREITIDGPNSWSMVRIWAKPPDTVFAVPNTTPRLAVMHDSFGAGPVASQYDTPAPITQDGWVRYMGDALGCPDTWSMSVGGTGFNIGNNGTKYHERACDLLNLMPDGSTKRTDWVPDLIIVKGSVNDVGAAAATIQANMTTLHRFVRTRNATVPILYGGVPWKANGSLSATQSLEATMRAQVEAFNDPLTAWMPESELADYQWVYGTGYEGATNNSGNSDYLVGTDATHPSYAGHEYRGRRQAMAVVEALATLRG